MTTGNAGLIRARTTGFKTVSLPGVLLNHIARPIFMIIIRVQTNACTAWIHIAWQLGYVTRGVRVTVVRSNCDEPLALALNQRPGAGVAMPSLGISCFGQRSMTTLR